MRRTKIIATIGPSSNTPETIERLLDAGMDVARLNFSHGTHAEHAEHIALLRACARAHNRPLAIMQDLQGPKIRTGELHNRTPIHLHPGQHLTITTHPIIGTTERVSTTYTDLPNDIHLGDRILLSDGLIELRVCAVTHDTVETEVLFGGELREHQGINLPDSEVSIPALTDKDAHDLAFGLAHGVDYIALSFVQRAADITNIKARIAAAGATTPVIAKIEKPAALNDLAAILDASDAIMIARGDLGVEMPPEQVPIVQKRLIDAANARGVPVITATQMLESMIRNPRPTRAEASDVANAIIDGTDAVMLSGETATGLFPVETVKIMGQIIEVAEASGRHGDHITTPHPIETPPSSIASAISAAACTIASTLPIRAIAAFTISGTTAKLVARLRPPVPLFAFTPSEDIYNRLNLVWGTIPILSPSVPHLEALRQRVGNLLLTRGSAQPGDLIVVIGGHPITARGTTNFVKIIQIEQNNRPT